MSLQLLNVILDSCGAHNKTSLAKPIIVDFTILQKLFSQLPDEKIKECFIFAMDYALTLSDENFGSFLKEGRNFLDMTQQDLSRLSGVSQGDICVLENGNNKKVKEYIFKIGNKQKSKVVCALKNAIAA